MPKGRWTAEEDQRLREWMAEGITVARISVRLRRSIEGIEGRCKALGLSTARGRFGKQRVAEAKPAPQSAPGEDQLHLDPTAQRTR